MKLIVLMGLVVEEKGELAVDLARHYSEKDLSVTVIDNLQRLRIALNPAENVSFVRLKGDPSAVLKRMLPLDTDIVILAAAETLDPDTLYGLLADLEAQSDEIKITTVALIDTRTCDCFPTIRERLEQYADVVVMLPSEVEKVVEALAV